MNKIKCIIITELKMNLRKKSFFISSMILPLIVTISLLSNLLSGTTVLNEQESLYIISNSSMLLMWIFFLIYGAQLFNSVRYEKGNKIIEIIATSVKPHIFLLGKIISIGIIGFLQLLICILLTSSIFFLSDISFPLTLSTSQISCLIYLIPILSFSFICGYLIYGSLYVIAGAFTEPDNDNQFYMIIVTIFLIGAMYASLYAIDEQNEALINILLFIPFTAPMTIAPTILTENYSPIIILLSCVIMLILSFAIIKISGAIYELTIISRETRPKISHIIRLIKR